MEDESIIDSLKGYLGVQKEDDAFDQDIVLHANNAFSVLYQVGVGKDKPIRIFDKEDAWGCLFQDYDKVLDMIKEYTFLRVRLLFDPPQNSSVMDSLKQTISECEYRIMMELDGTFEETEEYDDSESK